MAEPAISPFQKWANLMALATAEALAMGLWLSGSAVVPQLTAEWHLSGSQQAWMTMSVQLGFVAGALSSAVFNLADRYSSRTLMAVSALAGALFNAAILLPGAGPSMALLSRFFVGVFLAGVYPPGMKLAATWSVRDRGLGIGILVGALTLGKSFPHLLNIFEAGGMPPWRTILFIASLSAAVASGIVIRFVRPGPYLKKAAPFDWRFAGRALRERPLRLANFGYLGHMWELYAMWTWVPLFLIASYTRAGWNLRDARLAGFAVIAAGAVGCLLAGWLADRWGRSLISTGSLVISGLCCLLVGSLFGHPGALTLLCLVWGFAVVADSAQFSAAVSELGDPRYVGTALTMQTCLGFLLTLVPIRMVPLMMDRFGWDRAFWILAIGPAFGIFAMLRLRRLPEATRMASGNR